MINRLGSENHITELFTKEMAGGAFIYRADERKELLYANENLIRLYECADEEEFLAFTGNSFAGMVNETAFQMVQEDIRLQLEESQTNSGYVFFNIRTKKGKIRRVVNHYTKLPGTGTGEIICAFLYLHRYDHIGSELDSVTGLYGKLKFHKYVSNANENFLKRSQQTKAEDFAIIYLNLVNLSF